MTRVRKDLARCSIPWMPIAAAGVFLVAFLAGTARASDAAQVRLKRGQYVMGTVLEATVYAPQHEAAVLILEDAFKEAARLDAELSTFDPKSDLNRLNSRAGTGAIAVAPELTEVLDLSIRYWRLTGGTFDVTVGPLEALWRHAASQGRAPSGSEIAAVLARVGSDNIELRPDNTVTLRRGGMAVDLGGIGKGYALDVIARRLRKRDVHRAFLSFGQSSILALSTPAGRGGWTVIVRRPEGGFAGLVTLNNRSLSVSSTLGHSSEIAGRRYGHVIDPRTGRPVGRDLEACVVAKSAAEAEALSKALLILGGREGTALLERIAGAEGLLIEAGGKSWETTGWSRAVEFVPFERGSAPNRAKPSRMTNLSISLEEQTPR